PVDSFARALPALADIDHQVEAVAAGLSRGGDQGQVQLRRPAERAPAELDGAEAGLELGLDDACRLRRSVRHEGAGIGPDPLAPGAAQEGMDGLSRRLARDVPQRDLDPADGMDRRTPPAEIKSAPVHLFPEAPDLERILTYEERGK